MIYKGDMACDPRGLIYEAYRIDDISAEDCRSIFFDWALGVPAGEDAKQYVNDLLAHYGDPTHPMTAVLEEGLRSMDQTKGRRGGRKARVR